MVYIIVVMKKDTQSGTTKEATAASERHTMTKNERRAHEAILEATPVSNPIGSYKKGSRSTYATNLLELQREAHGFGFRSVRATDSTTRKVRRFTFKGLFGTLVEMNR